MDIEWGSDAARKFATNVGLTTSNGPNGYNIMATEWTHHISYSPGLIAICLHQDHATTENIRATKVFGVNICSEDQNVVSSVSGGSTGKEVDKIKVLEELGVKFYKAKKIDVMMVEGAVLNVECKLIKEVRLGSHIMFVGEALEVSNSDKKPLVLSQGQYWKLTENVKKPSQEERDRIEEIVEKHKK